MTALSIVTPPPIEPLGVEEVKEHLRVTADDENAYLEALIVAARHQVEIDTRRSLINTEWAWKLDRFPDVLRPPMGTVQSVASIQYIDNDGATQTWASSKYQTDFTTVPARIRPAYNETYPSTRSVLNAVTVTYTAGYGTEIEDVPEPLRLAIKMLVAHWYAAREPVSSVALVPVPFSLDGLVLPHKVWGF